MSRVFFVILIILGLYFPETAFSNGLPHFAVQKNPNGTIVSLSKVPVAVENEVLTIKISNNDAAIFTVDYRLKNLSSSNIKTSVIFPVSVGQNPSVIFEGHLLQTKKVKFSSDLPLKDFEVSKTWIDPYNNHQYIPRSPDKNSSFYYTPLNLEFVSFEINLKPKAEGRLIVTYAQPPSYDSTRLFADINYRFDYLLQPARHWANFKQLEINVVTNENVSLASSINLNKIAKGRYQAKFHRLPKENLSLFVGTKPNKARDIMYDLLNKIFSIKFGVFLMIISCWLYYKKLQRKRNCL